MMPEAYTSGLIAGAGWGVIFGVVLAALLYRYILGDDKGDKK